MTVAKGWDLQVAVFGALNAALSPTPGFTEVPERPPERYWRVDAFTMVATNEWRNHEEVDHGFTVHVFDSPSGGARSLQWVKSQIAAAHAALQGNVLGSGFGRLQMEVGNTGFEPREDGEREAHAFLRYTVIIGE